MYGGEETLKLARELAVSRVRVGEDSRILPVAETEFATSWERSLGQLHVLRVLAGLAKSRAETSGKVYSLSDRVSS